ncbi:regulator of cell morphogenesis and NO signaling [Catalinimonas alkaloidigena]|uniref:iron-sulfur cluster repair di-iron protein n=1 Tax=Catalinimonas alkaloidigena TaxID=1075417 RepID=UPI002405C74E|nr:iron-sulfur cluster repair di-iron protein [Catalinimonas alkaloidigena]MDF9801366.1 regulator of cell morphogenesis and NO signaling [Catalinimonas alkaloidigena]
MKKLVNPTIGEIVATDYRTATVFQKYGIDFCCRGNRTIEEACKDQPIDFEKILNDLAAIKKQKDDTGPEFRSWPLDQLVDYIQYKHHKYVEEKLEQIKPLLDKVCNVHGKYHPELYKIQKEFMEGAGELTKHMKKEEFILFPFIKKMATQGQVSSPLFKTVQNPISMMLHEHDTEGERFRKISSLTDQYAPPTDACNTYILTYALLKEFEEDLHLHIHLENNILFPKALALEKKLDH